VETRNKQTNNEQERNEEKREKKNIFKNKGIQYQGAK
jgi:hypothetical protein